MEAITMEKAMELARLAHGAGAAEDELKKTVERILQNSEKETVVEAAKEVCEIAKGVLEDAKVAIGGGIMAEPATEMEEKAKEPEDFIIRFEKPYAFEHKTYAGVDLSGLNNLCSKDIWKINRSYRNAGNIGLLQEMDAEYTARVAARASGMPIEFFEGLSLPDMIKIRTMVSNFFMPKE